MKPISVTRGADGRRDFFWLDSGFRMTTSSPVRGLGFNLHFGGIFTSAPVAVASQQRKRVISVDPGTLPPLQPAPGRTPPLTGPVLTPTGVLSGGLATIEARAPVAEPGIASAGFTFQIVDRLDLFGLGLDYAMYHKTFAGKFDRDDTGPWRNLGGVFVSAPAAVAWKGNRIDVFGLGTDHALFTKTATSGRFTPAWTRLGGAFTSAPCAVTEGPDRLHVFVRGSDFTLRGNQTDGSSWFGFQNHGGQLASAPAAVSWGTGRIDLFAIFTDGALWHRWWDGMIWNEWERLGGAYVGEPSAVSTAPGRIDVFARGQDGRLHHHHFEGDTWSLPAQRSIGSTQKLSESPSAVALSASAIEVFVPTEDRQIRIVRWDGATWGAGSAGAQLRVPQRYRMSVDHVRARTTRALNADTDAAAVSVKAGNNPTRTNTQWIGKIGGLGSPDQAQTNLLDFDNVSVDLAEPMSFNYIVVNNGHAPQDKILAALAAAGDSLNLSGSTSMQEDIGKGIASFVAVKITDALNLSIPVLGSVLGKLESWLLGKLTDAIFESCDGVVAVEMRAMMGADLWRLTDNGRKTVRVTTRHAGTDSAFVCGARSSYDVSWTIAPL